MYLEIAMDEDGKIEKIQISKIVGVKYQEFVVPLRMSLACLERYGLLIFMLQMQCYNNRKDEIEKGN